MPGFHIILTGERSNEARAHRRKGWYQGMGTAALKDYKPLMEKRLEQTFDIIKKHAKAGTLVNIAKLFSCLSCVIHTLCALVSRIHQEQV